MRLLTLLAVFAACAEEQQEEEARLDRNDPQAVARAALDAYRARDLAGLREVAGEGTRAVLDEMIAEGETHPRHKSIFGGFRWEAVSAWDGSISEARYSPRLVYVRFAESEGKIVVVKLARENGALVFEDISNVSRDHFSSMPTEPPK